MSKLERLLNNYKRHISIPWQDVAPAQRVIFCIYQEGLERSLRAKIDEFEITTVGAGYKWALFDFTALFADWLTGQRYAEKYFQQPRLLRVLLPNFLTYIEGQFQKFLRDTGVDNNTVVALQGVSSLFGFLRVKDVVERLAPLVNGRLLVFFPGTYENNNYRLLDAYDGWDYLSVPITPDQVF
jgi:hypothetical protein